MTPEEAAELGFYHGYNDRNLRKVPDEVRDVYMSSFYEGQNQRSLEFGVGQEIY